MPASVAAIPLYDQRIGCRRDKDLRCHPKGGYPLNGRSGRRLALPLVVLVAALAGAPSAFSQQAGTPPTPEATPSVTAGDIVFFPGPLESLSGDDAVTRSDKLGRNIPGGNYVAGDGWWALTCDTDDEKPDSQRGCRLSKTSLSVSAGTHPVYSDAPVASQLLYWSPLPDRLDVGIPLGNKRTALMIVFKPSGALAHMKLQEGPITTYLHSGLEHYPATGSPGQSEVRIPTGNGSHADLVPRIRLSSLASKTGALVDLRSGFQPEPNIDMLELREGTLRQRLPGGWTGCRSADVDGGGVTPPKQYLWWAGDLDGDGKLDLIVSWDDDADMTLYLSSLAKPGELVGFAGSFNFFSPSIGEC